MKITVQLTADDYVRARRLSMRLHPFMRYVLCIALVFLLVMLIWLGRETFLGRSKTSDFWFIYFVGAFLAVNHFVVMPWQTRRLFKQQKTLQEPAEMEFTSEQLRVTAPSGFLQMNWKDFHKWKRNKHMILLYHSAELMSMIPTRCFSNEEDLARFVSIMESNLGKEKA